MSLAAIHFHRLATKEFRKAVNWYKEKSETAAQMFLVAVDHAMQRIVNHPERLPKIDKRFHYVRVNRFPYKIVFEKNFPSDNQFMIFAVAHTSRRTDYWRKRPGS
jgi:hypothetical protein